MANVAAIDSPAGKLAGLSVNLSGFGKVGLTRQLCKNSETSLYSTTHPALVVKVFDLDCGKADEVSYGPYLGFQVEVENFGDIQAVEALRSKVPVYYGSDLDMERKFAYIAMEFLQGDNLLAWCQSAAAAGYPAEWAGELRAALYETLDIVKLFHDHGIMLIDFKPDNVIRSFNGLIRFVDLGAFFTPRHNRKMENYVYAATPDYAELVIDTSNVQTGVPLKQGSDIFSAGVGLFELATGSSRLGMAAECAEKLVARPALFRFRDSQIRDVWKAYPHLRDLLPLVQTQLKEGRILFSEFWYLLKGYLASEMPNWESLSEEEHRQALLTTGTTFIAEQLPEPLQWLANPIAHATTLRSFRLKDVGELLQLIADPIPQSVLEDILQHNVALQVARDLDPPIQFRERLNVWEVRLNPHSQHWAISGPVTASELREVAVFTFLKEVGRDDFGYRFYQIVGDLEADDCEGGKLSLESLANDRSAWVGG